MIEKRLEYWNIGILEYWARRAAYTHHSIIPSFHHSDPPVFRRRGVALLMVLLIVMAITVISLGFAARMDTELLCGQNTLLRLQMEQLAESGLEHARGLILHPQDVPATFWEQGAVGQQLVAESRDYYDILPIRQPDLTDHCTYEIECEAYRRPLGGEKIARSRLAATLRLDPCIGLWTSGDLPFRQTWTLRGDLRSGGRIVSRAARESIHGDAFSLALEGAIVGRWSEVGQLSLPPHPVTGDYTNLEYANGTISGPLSNCSYQPAIWRCTGDLILNGSVTIEGMLLVTGNLTIRGNTNRILAAVNLPALYVSGDLIIENVNDLRIEGLAVVDREVRISAAASNVVIQGAIFVGGTLLETTVDASGNSRTGLLRGNPTWTAGQLDGALQLNGPGEYVDCGVNPAFDIPDRITVAAWVKTSDAGDGEYHPYVTKGDSTYALQHRRQAADTTDSIEFFVYDGTWQSARFPVDPNYFNGQWRHLAGTYDGTKVRLYLDGVPVADANHTGAIAVQAADPLYLGASSAWPERGYQGALDDVRIYNRALSEVEIGQVMTGGAVSSGLVARWALNGPGSGVTILADPRKAAIAAGMPGEPTHWMPAAGGFFRKIWRP
jgi:hypothetical protein